MVEVVVADGALEAVVAGGGGAVRFFDALDEADLAEIVDVADEQDDLGLA